MWVQSLVREIRSQMLCRVVKKTKQQQKKTEMCKMNAHRSWWKLIKTCCLVHSATAIVTFLYKDRTLGRRAHKNLCTIHATACKSIIISNKKYFKNKWLIQVNLNPIFWFSILTGKKKYITVNNLHFYLIACLSWYFGYGSSVTIWAVL